MENTEIMTNEEVMDVIDYEEPTGSNWLTGAIGIAIGVGATILTQKVIVPATKKIRDKRKAKKQEEEVVVVKASDLEAE